MENFLVSMVSMEKQKEKFHANKQKNQWKKQRIF